MIGRRLGKSVPDRAGAHVRARAHPSIREKSATRWTASRIRARRTSRASRLAGSGSLTVTLSKNASTGRAQAGQRRHRAFEILRLDRGAGAGLGRIEGRDQGSLLCFGRVGKRFVLALFRRMAVPARAGIQFRLRLGPGLRRGAPGVPSLLLEDVGRALVAGEEVGALGRLDEDLERSTRASRRTRSSSPPSAKTASIRSCRTPASRCWTLRRSAKKSRRCPSVVLMVPRQPSRDLAAPFSPEIRPRTSRSASG